MSFIFIIVLSIIGCIIEAFLLFKVLLILDTSFYWLLLFSKIFSFIVVLIIVKKSKALNKDIPWIIIILLFPFIGTFIYFVLGSDLLKSKVLKKIAKSLETNKQYFLEDQKVRKEILQRKDPTLMYLSEYCNFLVTKSNKVEYYKTGELFFEKVKQELKLAQKFIFIEFFTIEIGNLWNEILTILEEKVKSGIEVRIIYDNTACMKKLPAKYYKKLESLGIKCEPFEKKCPLLGVIRNHRDHHKCIIIDGKIAFTGGMNIEDRYVNLENPYGYWKDVGISISGNSVWSFTVMFLNMWKVLANVLEDYTKYKYLEEEIVNSKSYVIPFGDNPLDNENIGKNTYINIINNAKKYLYVYTPYLIIDEDMHNALALATKKGVDIKIIIPGIPDKKSVYQVSLSNARKLIKDKVNIYTYTPGFMHGKVFISDDNIATVSTINTDYRSLYFDFEYGVLMQNVDAIKDIKKDVEETLQKSKKVIITKTNPLKYLIDAFLQLFSPLM